MRDREIVGDLLLKKVVLREETGERRRSVAGINVGLRQRTEKIVTQLIVNVQRTRSI